MSAVVAKPRQATAMLAIFDFDGTLADTLDQLFQPINETGHRE